MPSISRLLIRTGAVYLALAMTAGVVVALPRGIVPPGIRLGLDPAAIHLLAVGWITQLIFGVALWMFPRPPGVRKPREFALDRVAWALLNGGLLARLVAEPARMEAADDGVWGVLLLASAVAQWAAILYFVGRLWPRVRSR